MFIDVFQANEEKSIRRLKVKFAEEQRRIFQTMGWRDYNQSRQSFGILWRFGSRGSQNVSDYARARRKEREKG